MKILYLTDLIVFINPTFLWTSSMSETAGWNRVKHVTKDIVIKAEDDELASKKCWASARPQAETGFCKVVS